MAPTHLPSWLITSFDIDVEKDVILGSGGFGTVKQGVWQGTTVAVKLMNCETDQKVRVLSSLCDGTWKEADVVL